MTDSLPRRWMSEQQGQGHVVCLVLNAESERELRQSLLQTCRHDEYLSVYNDTPVADLADAGPFFFIIQQPEDRRMRALLKHPQRNWGWLASLQTGDLYRLASHWRERLMVGARPHQALYRFQDNRVLSRALAHLSAEVYPAYLGPAISVCYWQGEHWQCTQNPAPGAHAVPADPPWHHVPAPRQQMAEIRQANAHRYLLAEQVHAYAKLAEQQDPEVWLRDRLAQAEAWGWQAPEQLEFLLIQSLQAPTCTLAPHWQVLPDETSHEHFERVRQATVLAQRDNGL